MTIINVAYELADKEAKAAYETIEKAVLATALAEEAASELEDKDYYIWANKQNLKINQEFGLYHNY